MRPIHGPKLNEEERSSEWPLNQSMASSRRWLSGHQIDQPSVSMIVERVLNTLRLRQNGRDFADDISKCIFLNENVRILIKISLKFVPRGPINNISALVKITAWRRPGDRPLSEPMMIVLMTYKSVTRPQWVKWVYRVSPCSTFSVNLLWIVRVCYRGALVSVG